MDNRGIETLDLIKLLPTGRIRSKLVRNNLIIWDSCSKFRKSTKYYMRISRKLLRSRSLVLPFRFHRVMRLTGRQFQKLVLRLGQLDWIFLMIRGAEIKNNRLHQVDPKNQMLMTNLNLLLKFQFLSLLNQVISLRKIFHNLEKTKFFT